MDGKLWMEGMCVYPRCGWKETVCNLDVDGKKEGLAKEWMKGRCV
jgi:hypothetical protein